MMRQRRTCDNATTAMMRQRRRCAGQGDTDGHNQSRELSILPTLDPTLYYQMRLSRGMSGGKEAGSNLNGASQNTRGAYIHGDARSPARAVQ
eukprot:1079370-Prymnesium_polylepis.4